MLKTNCGKDKSCRCAGSAKQRRATIAANLTSSEIRFETHDTRDYVIVPVVMAKAGVVMNGSLTELKELQPDGWNGRPVTIGHPAVKGDFTSANSPEALSDWAVGQIFNAKVEDDALKGEAWIDVAKARSKRPGLVASLMQGEALDVSTGFFCVDEEEHGESQGKAYAVISRNWVPDHLALLPDEQGACNWADGCGVRSNTDGRLRMKLKTKVNKAVKDILAAVGGKANADVKKKVEASVKALFNERGEDGDSRQIVADLISNDASPFLPDDEDSLRMMSPDTLKKMRDQYINAAGDEEELVASEGEDEEIVAAEEGDEEEKVNGEDDEEIVAAEDDEEITAAEEEEEVKTAKKRKNSRYLTSADVAKIVANELKKAKLLSNDDRMALSAASKIARLHRADLIKKICANTTIPAKKVEAMDLRTLETVAAGVHPAPNYAGRFTANGNEVSDEDMLKGMIPPTTKSLIANRASKKEAH